MKLLPFLDELIYLPYTRTAVETKHYDPLDCFAMKLLVCNGKLSRIIREGKREMYSVAKPNRRATAMIDMR